MADTYFRSYEGRDDYLFVSYAHMNSARVVPFLSLLKRAPAGQPAHAAVAASQKKAGPSIRSAEKKRCYRIWYDEGIDAGSEWPENIERHMKGAAWILVFWSKDAADSRNCYRELVNAHTLGKSILFILLDDTPLPETYERQYPVLDAKTTGPEEMLRLVLQSGILPDSLVGAEYPPPPPPVWPKMLLLAVLTAAAVCAGLYVTSIPVSKPSESIAAAEASPGQPTPAPRQAEKTPETVQAVFTNPRIEDYVLTTLMRYDLMPLSFHSDVLQRAVYDRLRLPEDAPLPDAAAVAAIKELHICGDTYTGSSADITLQNGKYYADGKAVGNGNLNISGGQGGNDDYQVIASMTGLTRLSLCNLGMTEIGSLETLTELAYLDISGNPMAMESFHFLSKNANLKELNIAHTSIAWLQSAAGLTGLEKLYVSRDMAKVFASLYFQNAIPFAIVVVD